MSWLLAFCCASSRKAATGILGDDLGRAARASAGSRSSRTTWVLSENFSVRSFRTTWVLRPAKIRQHTLSDHADFTSLHVAKPAEVPACRSEGGVPSKADFILLGAKPCWVEKSTEAKVYRNEASVRPPS